jgi:hypothetical protein
MIHFYSFNGCSKSPKLDDCIEFKSKKTDLEFPCVVLMRFNNWNDYSHYTHFNAFFLKDKETEIIDLGTIMIIQSKAKDLTTNLPDEFTELSKEEYFSRGTLFFYNKLTENLEIKEDILSNLNDIHFHHYSREHICKIDSDLSDAYDNSLFRNDFYELEVSSEYAKNSLEIIDKINACLESLSKLDENSQKIVQKLLYGSVITALESYLGDAFKYHVINKKSFFYSFLKNYDFKNEKKYDLKELGLHGDKIGEFIENRIKEIMNNTIFHKVELVNELYKKILNVELHSSLMDFKDPIQKRHDIFHRNGKNIAGIDLEISSGDITNLIQSVKKFISETEKIITAQT